MKIYWAVLFFLTFTFLCLAQSEKHSWKPLILNDGEKFWFDGNSIDSTDGNKFNVWVLQMNKMPLQIEGVGEKVFRSKTLYAVNLDNVKYGILKVVYYNADNKEIFRHDYQINSISDEIKYTYPILDNSPLHKVIKEFFNHYGN